MNLMATPTELSKLIKDIQRERLKLDQAITSLERLDALKTEARKYLRGRRGRRFMDEQGRKEVSERMRKYWASRRQR